MRIRLLALWTILALIFVGAAIAQPPALVKDANTTHTGGTFQWPWSTEFVEMGGVSYFSVTDGIHGTELWRSDGTDAGTRLVRDVCPGACASAPRYLIAMGAHLYFAADDGEHGLELWKTDGTAGGTLLVKDAVPGLEGSNPAIPMELNGVLFYSAVASPQEGRELWRSDGTEAGTALFKEIHPGPAASNAAPLARLGGILLLAASEPDHGQELWRTDGTPAGTVLVKDIAPGSAHSNIPYGPPNPGDSLSAILGGRLFFSASDGTSGQELWASDGTEAGTVLVKDIHPGTLPSHPAVFVVFGGKILFRANTNALGAELWATDGTEANTTLVKEIRPGEFSSNPAELTALGPWVYFRANDGSLGAELWRTDGTEANTSLVEDIRPGSIGSFPSQLIAIGANLGFFADDGTTGLEPWKSDGTEPGTSQLADLAPGDAIFPTQPFSSISEVVGGLWYFRALDIDLDAEVYVSDGTPAGTHQLAEINDQTSAFQVEYTGMLFGANPMADLSGTLFYQADGGGTGAELWKSDGTEAGTAQVKEIFTDPEDVGSLPYEITPLGGSVLFSAIGDWAQGRELWISDGTEAGTALLKDLDITQGSPGGLPWWLTGAGGLVYFTTEFQAADQLWKSNGTPEGTVPVRETLPTSSDVSELTTVGNLLFYSATGHHGYELWKTNGTEAGTVEVADINPAGHSNPDRLTRVGNAVFFSADDGSSGRELWASSGAGAFQVKDIVPGAGSGIANTQDDVAFRFDHWATVTAPDTGRGKLLFPAQDGTAGEELWVSDGITLVTGRLRDIFPGPRSSEIHWLTSAGEQVYFVADDGTHGRELWVTNGTIPGTRLVADLFPGEGSSLPEQLKVVGRNLVFSAHTPDHGREPWVTNGDALGTRRLADLAPGPIPSSPVSFTLSGPWLYFAATDADTGFELYSVPQESVDGGLSFYTVTPCRLVDTRVGLGGTGLGTFDAAGLCGIPETAQAIVVNATVVNPSINGFLVLYPATSALTGTSSLSFNQGQDRANNATVRLGNGAFTAVALPEFDMSLHLVVDVSGYYE
jgi:trimeric autotransporter adhesin